MIITVTLNPAIDKTVLVENLVEGTLNRVKTIRLDPGGKGINVSKALCSYQVDQIATGILAGNSGRHLLSMLADYDFNKDFLMISGETRVNTKIKNQKTQLITEINEPGPNILKKDLDEFLRLLNRYLHTCDIIILSGSLPEGITPDFYAECIKRAKRMNICTILDADGEAFKLGCNAIPYAIKPNLRELQAITGRELSCFAEIRDEIKKIHKSGIELILISLGEKGSMLSYKGKTYYSKPFPVEVSSTVGAGDCMVAALAYCIQEGFSADDTARITAAAGCLTAAADGSKMADWKDINSVCREILIEEL